VIATYLGRGLLDKREEGQAAQGDEVEELPQLDPNLFADIGLVAI
jgi:hypothetical protein